MLFRDVIDLVVIEIKPDDNDVPSESETGRRKGIFANKKDVRQTEFYQAMQEGINLTGMFEIRKSEYNGENKLEYNGITYYILRTYSKNDEIIQLICSDKLMNVTKG